MTGQTDYVKISNSTFKNFDHISTNIGTTGITGFDIHNNTFENCGTMNFESRINGNNKYKRINVSHNQFLNCRLTLLGINEATISDNIIRYEPDGVDFVDFPISKRVFSNTYGLVTVSAANTVISNNVISSNAYESSVRVGLWTNTRANTSLKNMRIINNSVIGFNRPIYQSFGGQNTYRENIEISNNIIEVEDFGIGGSIGIQAGHGAILKNNKIKNINNTPAIKFFGTNTNNASFLGGVVMANICEGSTYNK